MFRFQVRRYFLLSMAVVDRNPLLVFLGLFAPVAVYWSPQGGSIVYGISLIGVYELGVSTAADPPRLRRHSLAGCVVTSTSSCGGVGKALSVAGCVVTSIYIACVCRCMGGVCACVLTSLGAEWMGLCRDILRTRCVCEHDPCSLPKAPSPRLEVEGGLCGTEVVCPKPRLEVIGRPLPRRGTRIPTS